MPNKSINDRYNNRLSHLYINTVNRGNTTPEENMTLMAHDLQFENHRNHLVGPYNLTEHTNNPLLNNKTLNLVKADEYNRKQAKNAIWNTLKVIHDSITIQPQASFQVLVFLIKPSKSRHSIKLTKSGITRNFERVKYNRKIGSFTSPEYSRMLKFRPKLMRLFRQLEVTTLLANIESVQYYLYLYVHMQGLLLVKQDVSVTKLEHQLKAKTGKNIELKPLRQPEKFHDKLGTLTYGNPVIYGNQPQMDNFAPRRQKVEPAAVFNGYNNKAVSAFVYYLYKQYKLPVAYGDSPRAKRALNRFKKLSQSEKLALIEAIQNSTYKKQLHYHISYKQWKRNHHSKPTARDADNLEPDNQNNSVDKSSFADDPQPIEPQPMSNPEQTTQAANKVFNSFIDEAQSKVSKDTQPNSKTSTDGNFRANKSKSNNTGYRTVIKSVRAIKKAKGIRAKNFSSLLLACLTFDNDVHKSVLYTNQAPIFFTEPVALQRKWKPLKPT